MRRLILGTAGHIDHGKTELVKALTGVDTDRLKEEKERGITIDLGFAELAAADDVQLGVVDVPGHEGFIRNMLAGATGMDIVVLVVAADEGVMPQTREHLSIVTLLGVERLVVALTKCDLVDEAWLDLVTDDVRELLLSTPYRDAPLVPTSSRTGQGLQELVTTLRAAADECGAGDETDLARLPIDRVFTVKGTGTVVTGTLWSGALRVGERVHLLPGERVARVRGLQVHGRDVQEARGGQRTAVALTGQQIEREDLARGQVLVSVEAWSASSVMTVRVRVLPDAEWVLERGQRVRVHLGTAERIARLVLLEADALLPGEIGWAQLRLEAPAVARAREPFVLRAYSPVTTLGGGLVAEPAAPKRTRLADDEVDALNALLEGGVDEAVAARTHLTGWSGEAVASLPVTTGLAPADLAAATAKVPSVEETAGSGSTAGICRLADAVISGAVVTEGCRRLLDAVDAFHADQPLRLGVDVETLRHSLPGHAHPALANALLSGLVSSGRLAIRESVVSRADFRATLSTAQAKLLGALVEAYRSASLSPPTLAELPAPLRDAPDLWPLLRILEADGRLTRLEDELFIWSEALADAGAQVKRALGGKSGLGPADFKDAVPVTRKHLLPILAHFDQVGITTRRGNVRDVTEG
jgi:selenocysteine-specific elongation factor